MNIRLKLAFSQNFQYGVCNQWQIRIIALNLGLIEGLKELVAVAVVPILIPMSGQKHRNHLPHLLASKNLKLLPVFVLKINQKFFSQCFYRSCH